MPNVFAVVENVPGYLPDNEPVLFETKAEATEYAHWRADGIAEAESEMQALSLEGDEPNPCTVDKVKSDDGAVITAKCGDSDNGWVIVVDIIEHEMSEDALNQWREQIASYA